ncbi:MAG: hypothetical protein R3C39_14390 [Dehalococcoidia bacterium]
MAAALAAAAIVLGCTGDSADEPSVDLTPAFDPQSADAAAHDALLAAADLPGSGWEVTARDDFEDGDFDFEAAMSGVEACASMEQLAAFGSMFGEDSSDQAEYVGHAQIEFTRVDVGFDLPDTVEVEIAVNATVTETRAGWSLVKTMIESDEFSGCMVAALQQAFHDDPEMEGMTVRVEAVPASELPAAPNDGAGFAMTMQIGIAPISFDMGLHMYTWPHSNGEITVTFTGPAEHLTDDYVRDVLERVDAKINGTASE